MQLDSLLSVHWSTELVNSQSYVSRAFSEIFVRNVRMNCYEWMLLVVTVVVLGGSGAAGIACMLSYIPSIQMYSFIGLLCCGIGGNVVSAAAVELYPTSSRWFLIKHFASDHFWLKFFVRNDSQSNGDKYRFTICPFGECCRLKYICLFT